MKRGGGGGVHQTAKGRNYSKFGVAEGKEVSQASKLRRVIMIILVALGILAIIGLGALVISIVALVENENENGTTDDISCTIDEDADGVPLCVDCNDTNDTIGVAMKWYIDEDGDGQGTLESVLISCDQPLGYSQVSIDCDDTDASVFYGADRCDITQLGQQFTLSPVTSTILRQLFGYSIKLFNTDKIVVGHPPFGIVIGSQVKGRMFVYKKLESPGAGENVYSLEADLIPIIGNAVADYGISVSGYENITVGLSKTESLNTTNNGSVSVFEYNGTWTNIERIDNPEQSIVTFISVDIFEETIIIGAHNDSGGDGRVYVYDRTGPSTWTLSQTLTSATSDEESYFGSVVSIDQTVIVVGAPFGSPSGLAIVFEYNGVAWVQNQSLSDVATFGISVDVADFRIVVGASGVDTASVTNHGAAYYYRKVSGVWTKIDTLIVPGRSKDDLCGSSVAIHNDTIVMACPGDNAFINNTGSIGIFTTPSGSSFNFVGKFIPFDISVEQGFGRFLGLRPQSIDVFESTVAGGGSGFLSTDAIEGRVYISSCMVVPSC